MISFSRLVAALGAAHDADGVIDRLLELVPAPASGL